MVTGAEDFTGSWVFLAEEDFCATTVAFSSNSSSLRENCRDLVKIRFCITFSSKTARLGWKWNLKCWSKSGEGKKKIKIKEKTLQSCSSWEASQLQVLGEAVELFEGCQD